MAAALKAVGEESVNYLACETGADNSSAHAENVCVIVETGVLGHVAVGADSSVSKTLLKDTSALLSQASAALENLKQKEADGNVRKKDARKQAFFYRDEIVPAMEALRAPVDALEMKVDRSFWPMPGYADLLFEV